jgi:AcrR family transcriptional regulator
MTGKAAKSPRKAKGHGAERREEILTAALRLFGEFGIHAVSTRQIAAAVGISQPTLYAYFSTKDEIGEELHNRAFVQLASRLKRLPRSDILTAGDLAAPLRAYVEFGLEQPDAYRIAFMLETVAHRPEPLTKPDLPEGSRDSFGVLHQMVVGLHNQGLTVDLDPDTLAQSLWAGLHGLVSLLIARPGFPWVERQHLIDSHLALLAGAVMRR